MSTHVRWPVDRFYWSVLEAPQWKRFGPLPEGIKALLEEDLPVPVETVHAVGAPLSGGGRLLVCAAAKDELDALGPEAVTLGPERLPELEEEGASLPAFNLLVGKYEPRSVRRARSRRHLLAAASVLVTAGLLAAGLIRREAAWRAEGLQAEAAVANAVAVIAPGSSPEAVALELARLRRLRESATKIQPPSDAAVSLAALLRAWPSTVSSKPQSLSISESGANVSVTVQGDPAPFLKALKPPTGWSMEEPRLNAADSLTRLTLQLRPAEARRALQ